KDGGRIFGRNQSGDVNVISNQPGAVFDVQTDAPMGIESGSGPASFTIYNAGTFRKSASSGVTAIYWAFKNSGTNDAQSGTISLRAGGTSSGTFTAASGAMILFTGDYGDYTCNSGTAFTGAGFKRLTGGTATLSGTMVATNLELAGAIVAGTST